MVEPKCNIVLGLINMLLAKHYANLLYKCYNTAKLCIKCCYVNVNNQAEIVMYIIMSIADKVHI